MHACMINNLWRVTFIPSHIYDLHWKCFARAYMHKVIYKSSAHQSSQASDCRWPVAQAPTKGGWHRNNLIGEQVMRLLSLHLNKIGKSWAVHGRAEQLHVRVRFFMRNYNFKALTFTQSPIDREELTMMSSCACGGYRSEGTSMCM